tara:strand:+ start:204 stop:515 length:312 start_codon:yes stop_codon:yes gene_type:complete
MRNAIIGILVLILIASSMPLFAAQGGRKGASDKAYEHASDQAIFHRVGDWFATRGKSDKEKKAILTERKAKRKAAHVQKEAKKHKRKMEKKGSKMKKEAKGYK